MPATWVGERSSIDFPGDQLADGRWFRVLMAVDQFSRECVCIELGQSLTSRAVTEALDGATVRHRQPETIALDNGTGVGCNHFDHWAYQCGIQLDFVTPGRPVENNLIESFNGKLCDECLNMYWFECPAEARAGIETWRHE